MLNPPFCSHLPQNPKSKNFVKYLNLLSDKIRANRRTFWDQWKTDKIALTRKTNIIQRWEVMPERHLQTPELRHSKP